MLPNTTTNGTSGTTGGGGKAPPLLHSHALIEHPLISPISFLISDCPLPEQVPEFIMLQKSFNSSNVIRISKPTYDATLLDSEGINVHEFYFEDGAFPPQEILERYFALLDKLLDQAGLGSGGGGEVAPVPKEKGKSPPSSTTGGGGGGGAQPTPKKICIGIHCVSGIGRAPLLVCIALVNGGMDRLDAVEYIRKSRRGAINNKQLTWLLDTKKGFIKPPKKRRSGKGFFSRFFGLK